MLVAPGQDELDEAVTRTHRDARPGDLSLLYLAGHWDGAPLLQLGRVLSDQAAVLWPDAFLPGPESRGVQHVLVLDCCGGPVDWSADLLIPPGVAILESQAEDPDRPVRPSLTECLVTGLRTGAADLDHNGEITVSEWVRFGGVGLINPTHDGDHTVIARNAFWSGVEAPDLLADIDEVLEDDPVGFVRDFVQREAPSFEQMSEIAAVVGARHRIPPAALRRLLAGDQSAAIRVVSGWPALAGLLDDPFAVAHLTAALRRADDRERSSAEADLRTSIADGDWETARRVSRDDADLSQQTGFVTLPDPARGIVAGLWRRLTGGVGARTTAHRGTVDLDLMTAESASPPAESFVPADRPLDSDEAVVRAVLDAMGQRVRQMADALNHVFDMKVSLRGSGEFRARARTGAAMCHVIFDSGYAGLGISEVAPKLMNREAELIRDGIDYLIVAAAQGAIAEPLRRQALAWNERRAYPFTVVTIDGDDVGTPAALAAMLPARPRLPPVWQEYLDRPARLCMVGEVPATLDASFRQQLPVRALNESGSLLDGTLLDHVNAWLDEERAPTLMLLGDFGDGKTFFTYNLARRLCEAGASRFIPIRLALSELTAAGSGRELLRQRLEYLGADLASWNRLVEEHRTLVILDGFDEMSGDLSWSQVARNVTLLRDCCHEFSRSKVLITSRSHVFGAAEVQRAVLERIERPPVFRLAPIERAEVISALRQGAADRQLRQIVDRLQELHDPVGLATKPLYYEMIREMLPRLSGSEFDEHLLYESYVANSLHRKLELLEDERLLVRPDEIVGNLLRIMESVALTLHRGNVPYVYLKDFEQRLGRSGGSNQGFAQLLWRMHDGDEAVRADAAARVRIRSLLKRAPGDDEERWPVDFFHRSMREYFVARAVAQAIADGPAPAADVLGDRLLAPEILHFTALILAGRTDPAGRATLERIAHESRIGGSAAGANAASLLVAATGQLPGDDWAGLNLDGASLAGADLGGKSFRGSTLRAAVLDNADLTGTDLRDADLTGVRLQETAAVTAITTRGDDRVYAAYDDGTIREWRLTAHRATDTVLHTLPFPAGRLWFVAPEVLGAAGDGQIGILGQEQGEWRPVSLFKTQSRYRSPAYEKEMALIVEDGGAVHWFAPATGDSTTLRHPGAVAWAVHGKIGYAVATRSELILHTPGQAWSTTLTGARCMALRASAATGFEILTGHENGAVLVHHVNVARRTQPEPLRLRLHDGPVESVCFLGQDRLVSGGRDRRICLAPLDDNDSGPVRQLQVTFRCRGVRYDGVVGRHEQEMLRELSAARR
ncbi:hypothetical protein Ate02nite_46740 [Paractinoplanes tereljensis]|uniref:NACHT domain-containing protein n=2 Tax=Paractinoplanes tereljensis TaxID=571912 RepID=A0A919NQ12_9ACTN|nr:hypothetical protein Ate02nite_46740 [Actinoplanes tereljensis]